MNEQTTDLRETVRRRYAAAAVKVTGGNAACCGPEPVEVDENFGSALYADDDRDALPAAAVAASLGCGNPTPVADLRAGEHVLDLGSGGGVDVLLSARRVGPTGRAYGLDMTDEMLELALSKAEKAGATNVEFLKGAIEAIPLPANTIDVVISNCVINLSTDKPAVFTETFRVLKPGGRIRSRVPPGAAAGTDTATAAGRPTSVTGSRPAGGYRGRLWVMRHSLRGRSPSSKAWTSSSVQSSARASTRARSKKCTAKPPCSKMSSPRAVPVP
jgi:SAM-dependent methyltransferase